MTTQCVVCNAGFEDLLHVLRDCHLARVLWSGISVILENDSLNKTSVFEWMQHLEKKLNEREWEQVLCLSYFLWWNRNRVLHGEPSSNVTALKEDTLSLLHQYQNVKVIPSSTQESQIIRWKAPPSGVWKCNYDASIKENTTSYDIIIRDSEGHCVAWKTCTSQRSMDVMHAEAEAALHGIRFAHSIGGKKVIMEGDNLIIGEKLQISLSKSHHDPVLTISARI